MRARICAVLPLAVFVSACEHANPVGPGAITSTNALIAALQTQGAKVSSGDVLPNALPCLAVSRQLVFVNSGSITAFEYASAAAADGDASMISPDASVVTGNGCSAHINWIGPPHVYKRDQVIVVYAGSADDVVRPLEAIFGRPFASR